MDAPFCVDYSICGVGNTAILDAIQFDSLI